ncbi:TH1 protein [Chytriomyces sp. MP71]|nr:TH1 protein [Chytriomyces sp. MP71]
MTDSASITTSLADFSAALIASLARVVRESVHSSETNVRRLVREHVVPVVGESETATVYALAVLRRVTSSSSSSSALLPLAESADAAGPTKNNPLSTSDASAHHPPNTATSSNAKNSDVNLLLLRIVAEIEAALGPKARPYASAVHFAGRPQPEIVTAVTRICARDVQASDVFKLHSLYSGPSPPPVSYIRTAPFVEALIKNVFGATTTDTSMIDEKIWLLAYVSTVIEDTAPSSESPVSISTTLMQPTMDALKHVYTMFPKLTPDIDLRNDFKGLLETVKYPIAAAGLLFWISNYIADPLFYNQTSITGSGTERILIFELLNEIALVYPLQRAYVLEILGEAVLRDYEKVSPLIQIEIKRKFIDQIIFLLKLGYVIPALDFVLENSSKMDDALLIYFSRRVEELTESPYHRDIIEKLVAIISRIQVDNLAMNSSFFEAFLQAFHGSLVVGGGGGSSGGNVIDGGSLDVELFGVEEEEGDDDLLKRAINAELGRLPKQMT